MCKYFYLCPAIGSANDQHENFVQFVDDATGTPVRQIHEIAQYPEVARPNMGKLLYQAYWMTKTRGHANREMSHQQPK